MVMRGWSTRSRTPYNPRLRTPPDIVEKVLHLRRTYHLGPISIVWYLERYHGITISKTGVYRVLRRPHHEKYGHQSGRNHEDAIVAHPERWGFMEA